MKRLFAALLLSSACLFSSGCCALVDLAVAAIEHHDCKPKCRKCKPKPPCPPRPDRP